MHSRKLAEERGYKIVANIKYRANSPSLTAEVQQLKTADADVLMPSSYTTDGILLVKTMGELGYRPKAMVAQDAGFSEKALYDAVGDKIEGVISRASFSLDLAAKRPSVGKINEMFKARSGKDLNDLTSREFMGLLILADGIDRAKSTDGEKIREALAATDIPGERTIMPWKRVKFGAGRAKPRRRSGAVAMDRRQVRHHLPAIRGGRRGQVADERVTRRGRALAGGPAARLRLARAAFVS